MLDAGARISAWICGARGIDPKGTGVFQRTDGSTYDGFNIPGHRQIASPTSPTECPGDTGVTQLPSFRDRVAALVGAVPTVTPTPSLTAAISPTRGTVNAWVRVSVTGLAPGSSVTLAWAGKPLASEHPIVAGSTGSAAGRFRVPATPVGSYAVQILTSRGMRELFYTVVPRIKLIPGTASRGDIVNVSLRGFARRESVRIRWKRGESWVELARVTTSNTGSANVYVAVPTWVPDGPTSVRGDGSIARAQTNAFVVSGGPTAAEITPTSEPTASPTPTPASSPTVEPAETPTLESTPSPSPTATVPLEPTIAPTETPEPTTEPPTTPEADG
jgi:hypothetical protein